MSRRERDGLLTRATKGVGTLVGIAAEAHAHHKNKKGNPATAHRQANAPTDEAVLARETSQELEVPSRQYHSPQREDEHQTEAAELSGDSVDDLLPPSYEDALALTAVSSDQLSTQEILPLPSPIIIPQRRPGTSSRGWARAYAPILSTHKNISQSEFLAFLTDFQSSTKASPIFHAINIAAMAAGFVPSAIAMAVSFSVQISVRYAMAAQVHSRTNSFLDKANREIFWPVGLHAMITTFQPGRAGQQVVDVDTSRTQSRREEGGQELTIPESAQLILVPEEDATREEQSNWKKSSKFVSSYLDRRAQASNPDAYASTLGAAAGEKPKFASRYSDPNHPANSGSPLSLLTGGVINPRGGKDKVGGLLSKVQQIKNSGSEGRRGIGGGGGLLDRVASTVSNSSLDMKTRPSSDGDDFQRRLGPRSKTGQDIGLDGIKQVVRRAKTMQQDVLYLVIAEIPDDVKEEMRTMEQSQRQPAPSV